MKMVCMLGEGAWGTAIACLLASNGIKVKLWCQDPHVAQAIQTSRINTRYFPEITLSPLIEPVADIAHALENVSYIFQATPVKYLRAVLEQCKPHVDGKIWILLNKGIENETLFFPSQIVDDVIGNHTKKVVLAGPSFSYEVARQKITAVTIAGECTLSREIQHMLANDYFRPYTSNDIMGVQVGAAVKNVIALGIGMAEGAKLSNNTKAFLFTRGLHEMVTLSRACGGQESTIYGLSGVGDAVMSSMGTLGRNMSFGILMGQGKTLDELRRTHDVLPESINTTLSVYQYSKKRNLDLPVCQGIYSVVYEKNKIHTVIEKLMQRPLEDEC